MTKREKESAKAATEQYLRWLAGVRGIELPSYCQFRPSGIFKGDHCLLPMPGFGVPNVVTVERLDDSGEVIATHRIGLKPNGDIPLTAAAIKEMTGLSAVKTPKAPKMPASAQEPVSTVVSEAKAPVASPGHVSGDISALLARIARLEAHVGLVQRPKRTDAHERAIRRAWAMRGQMRAQADLDRRALLYANGVNASLTDQIEATRAQLVAVEAARSAAVQRAAHDEARAIDAETNVHIMTVERDTALALATSEETRAIGADRAATKARQALAAIEERADRLARVSIAMRRKVRIAEDATKRAQLDVVTIRASERKAIKRLSALRDAVDASPTVAKIIDRRIAA